MSRSKRSLIWRIHTYAATRDTVNAPKQIYAYARATVRVEKRNPILMTVPSAYFIARGTKRQFFTESYAKLTFRDYNAHDMLYVVNEAVRTFRNKTVWKEVVRRAMTTDFSWKIRAGEYEKLYDNGK